MKLVSFESTLPKNHLVWSESKVMVFRTPPAMRRLGTLLSVAHIFMYIALPLTGAILTGKTVMYWASLFGACLVLFSFYNFAGPNDIRLDGNTQIYERTTGWPWKPKTRRGSFENIKGVCITPTSGVLLLMKKRIWLYKGVVLSSSGPRTAAQVLAEDVSREFGFPIVPYLK